MPTDERLILTNEQLKGNPAVDPKIVEEALKMRRELEKLGVWEYSGSRVRNPFETRPGLNPSGAVENRFITQIQ